MHRLFRKEVDILIISHRGNQAGPKPGFENTPDYIQAALQHGFDCEVDVWYENGQLFLGHDEPTTPITIDFLEDSRLWVHGKSIETLDYLLNYPKVHCFYHENDDCTLTSRLYQWTFPGKVLTKRSICVLPEIYDFVPGKNESAGVCTDFPVTYQQKILEKG